MKNRHCQTAIIGRVNLCKSHGKPRKMARPKRFELPTPQIRSLWFYCRPDTSEPVANQDQRSINLRRAAKSSPYWPAMGLTAGALLRAASE